MHSDERRRRILILDDDPHIPRVLKIKLEREGYEVSTAINGEQGLELYCSSHFDLVLTDQMMPKMNGIEFAKRIRELHPDQRTPVIFLTGTMREEDLEFFESMENAHRVPKPPSPKQVIKLIDSILEDGDEEDEDE